MLTHTVPYMQAVLIRQAIVDILCRSSKISAYRVVEDSQTMEKKLLSYKCWEQVLAVCVLPGSITMGYSGSILYVSYPALSVVIFV